MKRVLIGICLIVGCGEAGALNTPYYEGVGTENEVVDEGQAPSADDTPERVYGTPPVPVPCEPGEVRVDIDMVDLTDSNGISFPGSVIIAASTDDERVENTGAQVPRSYPTSWTDFNLVDGGGPLTVSVGFTWVDFDGGEFDGEHLVPVLVECSFTIDELVEGAGYLVCEQQRYQLHLGYKFDPVVCSFE